MTDLMPHDKQAEEAVLGSLMIDPEMYYHVAAVLKPSDFYIHRNGWVFDAIGRLMNSHTDIDIVTVSSEMDRRGEDYGSSPFLTSLIMQSPSSFNAVSHARIVQEHSTRRKMIAHANETAKLAYSGEPINEVVTKVQTSAATATERSGSKRITAKEAASKAIDQVLAHPRRFSFGVKNLDETIGGIFPERLYIWAGYQGTGKSAYVIHNARENAELGHKVQIVSLEMSAEQIWLRMACGDLGISFDSVMGGEIDADTKSQVMDKVAELGEMYEENIIIYPAPMTLMDILSSAKTERPDILWIDHSRLITGKPKDLNQYEWAMHIPTFLRQEVAKMSDGGISTHLLMQLNRSSNKESRRPNMHDLRLGGEDDPDMVTLLYRPEVDPNTNILPFGQVPIEMICDKNRFGWTGTNEIIFDLPRQRFLPTEVFSPNKPYKQPAYAEV